MSTLRFRQVHLDFHTSEWCENVGGSFNADEFAGTLGDARANSVNIFAKCHHGYSYYPTKVGTPHPNLKRDLLGEQIETLPYTFSDGYIHVTPGAHTVVVIE